ncbi:kunitz-type serine protease inhibitor homolog dendrotoxin K [Drosophila busckii]|uniref:kunitz-type serine protease inhibitor homolog dendrotoxin K n=1 Tax=Drosophila busckii TaxID=30019 RepID=UPI00083ECD9D|nr:kunitz-type serine protease inhibitor homolog dendrotoxin K [Drosophila busckii]
MKVCLILSALVLQYIVFVNAEGCPLRPAEQNCQSSRNVGVSSYSNCILTKRLMWYYNPTIRDCLPLDFRGCGGNGNRYCSLKDCQQSCKHT